MTVIPCQLNADLKQQIKRFAETLKTEAHLLGDHGLEEHDFYNGGLFRGAIERIRGQFSATMREKRDFVRRVLEFMQDRELVSEWASALTQLEACGRIRRYTVAEAGVSKWTHCVTP